jgi:hypothetical protein
MYWMFFRTTYWIYTGVKDTTETIEGANFFIRFFIKSSFERKSRYLTIKRIDPKTTEGLMWLNLGKIRSMILNEFVITFQLPSHLLDYTLIKSQEWKLEPIPYIRLLLLRLYLLVVDPLLCVAFQIKYWSLLMMQSHLQVQVHLTL